MPRSRDHTRHQLLDVGAELLLQEGVATAFDVRLADACKRLDVTTGAAYQIWRRQEDFQHDLMMHIASNLDWTSAFVSTAVDDAMTDFDSPEAVIRSIGRFYFETLVSSPEFYLMLRLWSIRDPRPELVSAMRDAYREIQDGLSQVFDQAMHRFGNELKPEFTIDEMSITATAISEGMALRHRFDPEPTKGGDLYAEALFGLFQHFTRPASDTMA